MPENWQSISMIMILIPTLVFWISNPKPIFGQIWSEKVKAICLAWKLTRTRTHTHTHTHTHTNKHMQSISRMLILILRLIFWNSKPIFIFWTNLSQKSWILDFVWKLVHEVSWGCDCKDTEEGLEANIKMNNCIRCLLLLYFYRS